MPVCYYIHDLKVRLCISQKYQNINADYFSYVFPSFKIKVDCADTEFEEKLFTKSGSLYLNPSQLNALQLLFTFFNFKNHKNCVKICAFSCKIIRSIMKLIHNVKQMYILILLIVKCAIQVFPCNEKLRIIIYVYWNSMNRRMYYIWWKIAYIYVIFL